MTGYEKPLPEVNEKTARYWEGCREHKLLLPKCRACGEIFFFPNHFCPRCLSEDLEWIQSSGAGKVHTFSVIERPPIQSFAADVPYVVAIIELDEGPRMMSNIIEIAPGDVRVDMPVEVVFEDVTDDVTLPKFRPII